MDHRLFSLTLVNPLKESHKVSLHTQTRRQKIPNVIMHDYVNKVRLVNGLLFCDLVLIA